MKKIILTFFITAICTCAYSSSKDINLNTTQQLISLCDSQIPYEIATCYGYIRGVGDTVPFAALYTDKVTWSDEKNIFSPNDVLMTIRLLIKRNPSLENESPRSLIIVAFKLLGVVSFK